jgi:3-dehydroquinate synthase
MILPVETNGGGRYTIDIRNDFSGLSEYADPSKKYAIITDDNVYALYGREILYGIFGGHADVYIFKAGETSKNYDTVQGCYHMLLSKGHDRSSTLLALGGGVAGDICGFAASTFMRGIKFIQVPTTLLAMTDSSIGGKNGYDLDGTKNVIGTFYQPGIVYINLSCIRTLPAKEFSTGMAECIKHGLIQDGGYFDFIESSKNDLIACREDALMHLVSRSCEIKAALVGRDVSDSLGIRELLNFGHTVGHAVEAASDYLISHGEAVSIGINAALSVSDITFYDKERIRSLLSFFSLPLKYKGSRNDIIRHLSSDKKFKNGVYTYISLQKIGKAHGVEYRKIDKIIDIMDTVLEN